MKNRKKILVKFEFFMIKEYPEDFCQPENINFHLNESSHCLSNEIAELKEADDKMHEKGCCFVCGVMEASYVREATEADIAKYKLPE